MPSNFSSIDLACPPDFTKKQYFKDKNKVVLDVKEGKEIYVEITLFELTLLKVLTVQRTLSLVQIKEIYLAYYPIAYDTLQKKFKRWSEVGLVKSKDPHDNLKGVSIIYSIDSKGVQQLVNYRYLSKDWLDIDPTYYLRSMRNSIHSVGIQDVVTELLVNLKEDDISFESVSPTRYFGVNDKEFGVPDWLLRYKLDDNNYMDFYIEFDNNSESVNMLEDKLKTYIKRANKSPSSDINVLLSFIDYSFHYRIGKDIPSEEKLMNVKKRFLERVLPANLTINVNYRNRVFNVVRNIIHPVDKQKIIRPLIEHFKNTWGYQVEEILSDGFYRKEVPKNHYADVILEVRDNKHKLKERVGVIVAEEGDVGNFQRINGFYSAQKGRLFNNTVHHLIVLYENELAMDNDVLNTIFDKFVILSNNSALMGNDNKPFKQFTTGFQTKRIAYPFD